MTVAISADALWHYSLKVYGLKHNQVRLLWLQDNAHFNINILLSAGYLASLGCLLSAQQLQQMHAAIAQLDAHTQHLRSIRRAISTNAGQSNYKHSDDYKKALSEELESEKQQQVAIIEWCQKQPNMIIRNTNSKVAENLASQLLASSNFFQTLKLDCPEMSLDAQTLKLDCPAITPDTKNKLELMQKIEQSIGAISHEFIKMNAS